MNGHRVLHITPWFPNHPSDGGGNFIYHSVEALVEQGHDVRVLVVRPWTPKVFGMLRSEWRRPPLRIESFDPALNIRVRHFWRFPRFFFSELSTRMYRWSTDALIAEIVRDYKVEIIHAHTEWTGHGAVTVARALGLPVVVTLHAADTTPAVLDTARKRRRLSEMLTGADRVVLVGEPLRAHFGQFAPNADRFEVVPNGFYLPPDLPPRQRRTADRPLRIISVSLLREGKGVDLNLKALAMLHQCGCTNWTYAIVGDGPLRGALERMTAEFGLERHVTFHGMRPHPSALRLLSDADVFLLPSYREAFGVANLEAMAVGLVSIGVEGQGPSDFIQHGVTGLLVPPENVEAIAVLLRQLVEQPEWLEGMAAAGRAFARSKLTWGDSARSIGRIYDSILSTRSNA